ncbi:MAG: hypothetical protein V1875_05170 [Candidatus Altiarchaeota archaeon]
MERIEIVLTAVLMAIALLLGILFGGSSIWFLKPAEGGTQTNTVTKYVCSDGSVKDAQNQCPAISTSTDGKVVECPKCQTCPVCQSDSTTGSTMPTPSKYTECWQCAQNCAGIMIIPTTTTMTPPPVCKACTANSDCGVSSYSDFKCKNDEVYKDLLNPLCEQDKKTGEKCCQYEAVYTKLETCQNNMRCVKGQGCVLNEQAPDD